MNMEDIFDSFGDILGAFQDLAEDRLEEIEF